MSELSYNHVNTFFDNGLAGNPAIIYLDHLSISTELMAFIASKHPGITTAFLQKKDSGNYLSSFSPTGPIQFCGHATLAAAYLLTQDCDFHESMSLRSGTVITKVEKNVDFISLMLPIMGYQKLDLRHIPRLWTSEGSPLASYVGNETFILRFEREKDVLNFKPDLNVLKLRNWFLAVTAPGLDVDFVSRFFGPSSGIDEDAVTGSLHRVLYAIWSDILGRKNLKAKQKSKAGGLLLMDHAEDPNFFRLMGRCHLVKRGRRRIDSRSTPGFF